MKIQNYFYIYRYFIEMKNLNQYITEKFKISKDNSKITYNYHPKDGHELKDLIIELIKERGNEANLNDIDVSNVETMKWMFSYSKFNGDISEWNVSNVTNMSWMFWQSKFNGDISKWNVSNVKDMNGMFSGSPLEKNPPVWYHE